MKYYIFAVLLLSVNSLKQVLKFGGSSIKNLKRIENVGSIILDEKNKGNKPIVIFSAIDDTTNKLIKYGKQAVNDDYVDIYDFKNKHLEIIDSCSDKKLEKDVKRYFNEIENILSGIYLINDFSLSTKDKLVSYGERLSVRIISSYLNKYYNLNTKFYDSWDVGLISDNVFDDANFLPECDNNVDKTISYILDRDVIPIITGFICKSKQDKINTLGRGGSDLTATYIAKCINADEIQIWKDVDGLMTADPKNVKNSKPVPHITYNEARELAYFGANILHPTSMIPVLNTKIPVIIKNSYNKNHMGTIISKNRENKNLVTAITSKSNVTLVDIVSSRMLDQYGFLSKVFKIFEENKISIDVIATSEISVSLTLDDNNTLNEECLNKLIEISCVEIKENYSIISLISDVEKSSEILSKIFLILSNENINIEMISQGASKNNISLIIKNMYSDKVLNLIHKGFFE